MKIVAISDSHGSREAVKYIRNTYEKADLLIHCGDICLPKEYAKGFIIVAGNCDNPDFYPPAEIIEAEHHRLLILHGHMLFSGTNVNYKALARMAKRNECDIVFYGHSHIYDDRVTDGVRLLNPGSISANRDMTMPSYMVIDLTEDHVNVKRMEYIPV